MKSKEEIISEYLSQGLHMQHQQALDVFCLVLGVNRNAEIIDILSGRLFLTTIEWAINNPEDAKFLLNKNIKTDAQGIQTIWNIYMNGLVEFFKDEKRLNKAVESDFLEGNFPYASGKN